MGEAEGGAKTSFGQVKPITVCTRKVLEHEHNIDRDMGLVKRGAKSCAYVRRQWLTAREEQSTTP